VRLLFRGLHILGGRRFASGYRPLIALLRGPQERVEFLLSDVITETLPKILAGLFDGDPEPLLALITDLDVDEFVRAAAMGAFTFLVFDGRIERAFAEDHLRCFEQECAAPRGDMIWHAWMTAVALLGFGQMTERVHAAFIDGRIPPEVAGENYYRKLLADALARPDDAQRLADEHLGYIEDVLVELEQWPLGDVVSDDADDYGAADYDDGNLQPWSPSGGLPVRNPFAGVGRNDLCPCGSGKKFKKCCL
jgi:hypothetical protein